MKIRTLMATVAVLAFTCWILRPVARRAAERRVSLLQNAQLYRDVARYHRDHWLPIWRARAERDPRQARGLADTVAIARRAANIARELERRARYPRVLLGW